MPESKGGQTSVVVEDPTQAKYSVYDEQNSHITFSKGNPLTRLTVNSSGVFIVRHTLPSHSTLVPAM